MNSTLVVSSCAAGLFAYKGNMGSGHSAMALTTATAASFGILSFFRMGFKKYLGNAATPSLLPAAKINNKN